MDTLYVIHGSHACRTAMLVLDHKGIAYRTRALPTGMHPLAVRLLGFPGNPQPIRSVDGHSKGVLAGMDRLGTVPALNHEGRHIQTNRRIIEFAEQLRPDPPLYPADPAGRAAVEQAVEWGDGALQMAARRTVLAGGMGGLGALHERGADGRLGPLLARRAPLRVLDNAFAARLIFKAGGRQDSELLTDISPMLDRIDAWIADGTLNGERPNAADMTIAPSLALLDYRLDLRADLRSRPCYALIERFVPEPTPAG